MSIFDSKGGIYIEVDETNYPEYGREIIDYLHNMMKEPTVVRELIYEEMLNNEIKEERRQLIEQLEEEKRLKEEAKAREEVAKVREEKVKVREKAAILNLQKEGLSISKIASIFGITEEAVKNALSVS